MLLAASESLTLTYRGGYPAQIPGVYALQDLTTFSYSKSRTPTGLPYALIG